MIEPRHPVAAVRRMGIVAEQTRRELHWCSARELAALIGRRDVSPVEVVEAALSRIEEINPVLNCFYFLDAEGARAEARRQESALHRGERSGPLCGVPIAFKDMTPVRGTPTTAASRIFETNISDRSAAIVERLLANGAIFVGKTTMPELAKGGYTESSLWGITRNPWDPTRTPGGSSGGAAVAVATGCVPLAEGSDMGGSIRYPAALCGTVGLKPSLGRIPMDMLPTCFDGLFCFGPLARHVEDVALFMASSQGPDDHDIQSQLAKVDFDSRLDLAPVELRLALSMDLGYIAIDPAIEANTLAVVEALRAAGVVVDEVELGWSRQVHEAALTMARVWFAAAYGEYLPEWRDRMDSRLVTYMDEGMSVGAVSYKRIEFLRTRMWHDLARLFRTYDALLCPTTAVFPPAIGGADVEYYFEREGQYHGLDLTCPFNLVSQCPVLSVPSGFSPAGLPTGLQVVGSRFDDLTVIKVGALVERLCPWSNRRPAAAASH